MPPDPGLRLDPSGSLPRQRTESPKSIAARGRVQENIARVYIGGALLLILAVGYLVALCYGVQGSGEVLGILGMGLGFLLGRASRSSGSEE